MYQNETSEPANPMFRRFLDQNALTLWMMGVAILATAMALPAVV